MPRWRGCSRADTYRAPRLRGRVVEPDLTVRVSCVDHSRSPRCVSAPDRCIGATTSCDTGAGTLHPPTGCGVVRLAAPPPDGTVLDPFAGDGTIPIEAAVAYPALRVLAADLDPTRLRNAQRNAGRARAAIALFEADAAAPPLRHGQRNDDRGQPALERGCEA